MFPTKEAGDYFKSKFIVKKYNLDKADADNIAKTYGVVAYPTFIFLDADGKEISRILGGAKDTKDFIERVEKSVAEDNTWAVRNARFANDPSYAIEHIRFLKEDCYLMAEADKALKMLFEKRDIKENFNKANLDYYRKNVTDINSPVIQYMLNNKKAVIEVIGKSTYIEFIESRINNSIFDVAMRKGLNEDIISEFEAIAKKHKDMRTDVIKYFVGASDAITTKNVDELISLSMKSFISLSSKDRVAIARYTHRFAVVNGSAKKLIPFYQYCISKSGSDNYNYTQSLELVVSMISR